MIEQIYKNKEKYYFISFIVIRYLYVYLTVSILDGLWYPGSGGYGISFSVQKEIIASITFICISFLSSRRVFKSLFSEVFFVVLFVLYYIPINSAYSINNASDTFFVLTNLYFVLIMFLLCGFRNKVIVFKGNGYSVVRRLGNERISDSLEVKHYLNQNTIRVFMFFLCILFIAYKISYNGFSLSLIIDSEYVYSTRSAYVDYREGFTGSLFSYALSLISSLTSIIAPVYLYLSIEKKKAIPIIVSTLTIFAQYSISTGKGSLFFIPIILIVFFFSKQGKEKYFPLLFLVGMIVLLLICMISLFLWNNTGLYFLIIRREMYYPAWLNNMYYEFFNQGPKLLFSESAFLLQRILPNPYGKTPLLLISESFFGGLAQAPNTGLFAEAYMQLGVLGLVFFPIVLSLLLHFSDHTISQYGKGLTIVMAVRIAMTMINVPIFRTDFVLSIGLILIVLRVFPRIKLDLPA